MKKRSAAAAKIIANLLDSPLPLATSYHSRDSPSKPFDFSLKGFKTSATKKKTVTVAAASVLIQPRTTRSPSEKAPTTIADLKDLVSSRSDPVKRHLDLSHSEILREFEASQSRISKRFKIHTQACQQMMDEAENDYKKLSDRISENSEIVQTSFAELTAEVHAKAARVTKTSIPELAQSMEKAIEGLRNSYGIASASALTHSVIIVYRKFSVSSVFLVLVSILCS